MTKLACYRKGYRKRKQIIPAFNEVSLIKKAVFYTAQDLVITRVYCP